jgi:hypothetical protein
VFFHFLCFAIATNADIFAFQSYHISNCSVAVTWLLTFFFPIPVYEIVEVVLTPYIQLANWAYADAKCVSVGHHILNVSTNVT